MNRFAIVKEQTAAVFCINQAAKEYQGLKRVTGYVQQDMKTITGILPEVYEMNSDRLPEENVYQGRNLIVAGTIGENPYIDQKIAENRVNVREIEGKRECYRMLVITDQQAAKGSNLLIIVGSDKLGTFYGLLHLSELMGISPWQYWGDVKPVTRKEIEIGYDQLSCVSREPSIRYRGFFLNDEWPSLGKFVMQAFGGFNELFYEKVFELLLRLKGNFLWPAMWSASFRLDGKENPLANAMLADELGIVMGTSHHEPLMRAGEEFNHFKSNSNEEGYGKDWDYYRNPRGLEQFWKDSVIRNQPFKNLITIGMRGERDSKILGENSGLKENIQLLKDVILAQKRILKEHGMEKEPKVLALYKEVEDYYYGDEKNEGLEQWKELEDVMLLLSDDNFGNTRTLPTKANWNRKGGWGLYYHLDYHGGPISYEWINSTPITKVWEQMCMAYEYGIRDLWIVNVGDLRPVELPLNYFMDLAYDFDQYGSKALNTTGAYLKQWVKQNFGQWLEDKRLAVIENLLNGYTRMNGDRRPEAVYSDTFSILQEHEAWRELNRAKQLEHQAETLGYKMPQEAKDAYYGLVSFPAMAAANLRKMQIYAGLNEYFMRERCELANYFHQRTQECILKDQELVRGYNEEMSGGKWNGMMSSNHVGFHCWNDEGWSYPMTDQLCDKQWEETILFTEGNEHGITSGDVVLPVFTSIEKESYEMLLCHAENSSVDFCRESWVDIKQESINSKATRFIIQVNWEECKQDCDAVLRIAVDHKIFTVLIQVRQIEMPQNLSGRVYVESKGYISMEAIHYTAKSEPNEKMTDERIHALAWNPLQKFLQPLEYTDSGYCCPEWKAIENYGRGDGAMKVFPAVTECQEIQNAPSLEYRFYLHHSGEYTMKVYLAPSNPLMKKQGMRIGYSMDEAAFDISDTVPEGYRAGESEDPTWSRAVLNNVRENIRKYQLSEGLHTLKIAYVDPGIVVQKIELYQKESNTYYGYRETFHL